MAAEKTEQPSEKRLRDARKSGQLPRSRILSTTTVVAGGLAGLLLSADASGTRLAVYTTLLLSPSSGTSPAQALSDGLQILVLSVAPVLGGALAAAIGVSVAFAGFELNVSTLAPDFSRLDPSKGFKRLASTRQLSDIGKGLLVLLGVALVARAAALNELRTGLKAAELEGGAASIAAFQLLVPWLWRGIVVVLVVGALEFVLAKRRHRQDLMMTRDEVRREHREAEGDPRHKGQRKALHRQISQGGPARGVRAAHAVIVNPTHIAVALRYAPGECEAPYLVARARESEALQLRREAASFGIPIVKDIPLARSLIHFDVGEEIPEELYQAAAAVLKVAADRNPKPEWSLS